MQSSIFKQVVIVILACIAILLALALILYQYIPSNKVIPSKVEAYTMPENIKSEISDSTQQELNGKAEIYEITDADLDMYKSSKSYNPGKSDPFAGYSENTTNTTTVEGSNATSGSTVREISPKNNTTEEKAVNKNTTDNYYTAANVSKGSK